MKCDGERNWDKKIRKTAKTQKYIMGKSTLCNDYHNFTFMAIQCVNTRHNFRSYVIAIFLHTIHFKTVDL